MGVDLAGVVIALSQTVFEVCSWIGGPVAFAWAVVVAELNEDTIGLGRQSVWPQSDPSLRPSIVGSMCWISSAG